MNLPKTDDKDRTHKNDTNISKNDTNDTPSWHMVNAKMDPFVKIIKGFQPLTIFTKCSALDVWQGSKNVSFLFLKAVC